MTKVFFITGCSSGFGAALVECCLAAGDKVVATSRDASSLRFAAATPDNFLGVTMDIASPASVDEALVSAVAAFSRVDVVVNNAGRGLCGAFEELSDADLQAVMDVNFMGVARVTRAAIRVMRDVNDPPGGLIQQVTSIGGQLGMPAMGGYCASKWAVEGLTECVAREMEARPEWNIRLTCLEPGGFRTEWARGSMALRDAGQSLPVYSHLRAEDVMPKMRDAQIGDPKKGAAAMRRLAYLDSPPLRSLIGSEAFGAMEMKLKMYGDTYRQHEDICLPVDVDGAVVYGAEMLQSTS
jgi:NAD(P)-dependent dehydrogenase (short-subunit alcohol dehydrogenase family)